MPLFTKKYYSANYQVVDKICEIMKILKDRDIEQVIEAAWMGFIITLEQRKELEKKYNIEILQNASS